MKPKAVIITDPKKMSVICANQPRVSREQAIRSILAANRAHPPPQQPAKMPPGASVLLPAAAKLWEPTEED
jgi:hypothetical protein